ncbi:hypothetical protein V6N13_148368 [Hibiscus sabdariffa]
MENKDIHWVRWELLCLPKECGGLWLVDFEVKNRALLNKWLWRYGTESESLWRKVISTKYLEDERLLLSCNLKPANKSWIWKNILSTMIEVDGFFNQHIKLVVAVLKEGVIPEFGFFLEVVPRKGRYDTIKWARAANGMYSSKSYCKIASFEGKVCESV